jgi:hypothetical protein
VQKHLLQRVNVTASTPVHFPPFTIIIVKGILQKQDAFCFNNPAQLVALFFDSVEKIIQHTTGNTTCF